MLEYGLPSLATGSAGPLAGPRRRVERRARAHLRIVASADGQEALTAGSSKEVLEIGQDGCKDGLPNRIATDYLLDSRIIRK